MRLFVETNSPSILIGNLKTWHPVETSEAMLYGNRTKGLIVENFQLDTEFPDNLEEFRGYRWAILPDKSNDVIKLVPKCVKMSEVEEDSEALNASLIFIAIIVIIWITFAWS